MDAVYIHRSKCTPFPIRFLSHRAPPSNVIPKVVSIKSPKSRSLYCASSSETLVNKSQKSQQDMERKDESDDLKSWMHKNGLPPCKVVLEEKPSYHSNYQPIHYVAASEDLEAGDIAFSVPNSLVVTLESLGK